MLDQIFKGEVPSIFETTIKRDDGKPYQPSQPVTRDYRNEEEFLRSHKATLCYCGSFLTFGMSAAVIGPTLLELGCVAGRPVNIISWVFFSQALSALFGSSIGGIMADRYDCSIILLVCVTSVAVCLAIIPVCAIFSLMLTFFALLGVNMGIIDTIANSILIKIHGKKVAPRLQTLHFFYGIGALLSPVIAEPFLRSACEGGHFESNIFGWTLENSTFTEEIINELVYNNFNVSQLNFSRLTRISLVRNNSRSFVQYAYWIVAALQLPVQAGLIYLIFKQRQVRRWSPVIFTGRVVNIAAIPARNPDDPEGKELSQIFRPIETQPAKGSIGDVLAKVPIIIFLCGLILFFFDGLQGAYGGYLYTYAVKSDVHFKPSHGAYLNSLFWCLFATGRFFSIFLSMFVRPDKMLMTNLVGSFIAMSVMFYLHAYPLSLWIGTCLLGLFMSSVFPSTLSVAELYIEVSGSLTSIMIVSSASGEMLIPLLVGKEFAKKGPLSFLIVGFVICIFALITLLILRMVGRSRLKLTVSELFHVVIGGACHCNSSYKEYFESEGCEYTQMIPCDVEAVEATADNMKPKSQDFSPEDQSTSNPEENIENICQ